MSTAATVDLHLHSTASDGLLGPAELVAHAAAAGVTALSLTDHDTLGGLDEAWAAAAAHGLAFVPGIELSAEWRGRTIHVIGLAVDTTSLPLAAGLARQSAWREARAREIARLLDRAGAPGTAAYERVAASGTVPTRTHFARELVALGAAADAQHAFDHWLKRGARAHVAGEWLPLVEAVGLLAGAGGAAVLAHPLRYQLSAGQRRELAAEFREAGGVAVEIATGGASRAQLDDGISLAVRTGLEGSAGSDFHGPAAAWNTPGRLAKLPASIRPVWHRFGW